MAGVSWDGSNEARAILRAHGTEMDGMKRRDYFSCDGYRIQCRIDSEGPALGAITPPHALFVTAQVAKAFLFMARSLGSRTTGRCMGGCAALDRRSLGSEPRQWTEVFKFSPLTGSRGDQLSVSG